MSNSTLICCTIPSPHHSGKRTHAIDRISVHCMAGNLSVESCGALFARESREASSNYGIGSDGRIGLYVDEANRSWCTSSRANDQRAVTIEVANTKAADPWPVSDAAYNALLDLMTDICKRNGRSKVIWIPDKDDALAYEPKDGELVLTVHRWFAAKACPGDYLYDRHNAIAEAVNARLGGDTTQDTGSADSGSQAPTSYPATPFRVRVIINDLNYRSGPGMGYQVKGQTGKGVFTIVEVQGDWGKLKSGAGWILLSNPNYCTFDGQPKPVIDEAATAAAWTAIDAAVKQLTAAGNSVEAIREKMTQLLASA